VKEVTTGSNSVGGKGGEVEKCLRNFGGDPLESECLEDRKKFFFLEIYYT
jgi:hypothetical protein